jgi:hypothetical protein
MNQIVFYILLLRDFAGLGGSKSISMALVKIKPLNEVGDIMSEPCIEFNNFRVVSFCSEDFAGMKGISSYLWPLRRQIHRMSWDISFQNLV